MLRGPLAVIARVWLALKVPTPLWLLAPLLGVLFLLGPLTMGVLGWLDGSSFGSEERAHFVLFSCGFVVSNTFVLVLLPVFACLLPVLGTLTPSVVTVIDPLLPLIVPALRTVLPVGPLLRARRPFTGSGSFSQAWPLADTGCSRGQLRRAFAEASAGECTSERSSDCSSSCGTEEIPEVTFARALAGARTGTRAIASTGLVRREL